MLGLIVEDDVIQFIWVLVDFYDSLLYKAHMLVQSFIMGFLLNIETNVMKTQEPLSVTEKCENLKLLKPIQ